MYQKYSILFAITSALFFSINLSMAPFAYANGATVSSFLVIRYLITTLLAIYITKSFLLTQGYKQVRIYIIVVLLTILGQAFGTMTAIKLLPLSIAITIYYTFPIITYFLDQLEKKQKWSLLNIAIFAIALSGIWLLGNSGPKTETLVLAGFIWGMFAAICQAIMNQSIKKIASLSDWQIVQFTAMVPLFVFSLIFLSENNLSAPKSMNMHALFWSVLSACSYCIAVFCFFKSTRLNGSVRTSNALYLEPVFTVSFGLFIFHEQLSPLQIFGILLIAASTLTIEHKERKTPNSLQ